MYTLKVIIKNRTSVIMAIVTLMVLVSCASIKTDDVRFVGDEMSITQSEPKLDIYQPNKPGQYPVMIFIHGGYWDEGDKGIYGFLGRNFAQKDVVTVIPNYTLSPEGNYDSMAKEVAAAVQWSYNNINSYHGDPSQIYLMGHSAGGHLIALATTNPKYLGDANLVKGVILNDSAGLDMYSYLQKYPPTPDFHHYTDTWTKSPENWKDASPIYFLSESAPPFLIYVGSKTYPSIIDSNKDFVNLLRDYQPSVKINYLDKKHVPMMRQFVYPWNKQYRTITDFMDTHE